MSDAAVESYLSSKTAEQILESYEVMFGGMITSGGQGMSLFPNIFRDGTVIPASGHDTLETGSYPNKVPIILGSNKEETKLFLFADPHFFFKEALYQTVATYSSDVWKGKGADEVARRLRRHEDQPGVYAYLFQWGAGGDTGESAIPDPWGFILGSAHTMEIPFFFGNDVLDVALQFLVFNEENRPGREALSSAMMTYLAQFARTGDPNTAGSGLPEWRAWSSEANTPKTILFDVDQSQAVDIEMSNEEFTESGVKERMVHEVPEPLYSEALEYLENMGLFW